MSTAPAGTTGQDVVDDHTDFRPTALADPSRYKELRVAHAQMVSKAANPEFPRLHEWASYRYIKIVLECWFNLSQFQPYAAVVEQAYLAKKMKDKEKKETNPNGIPDFAIAVSIPNIPGDECQMPSSRCVVQGAVIHQDPLRIFNLPAIMEVKKLPPMGCSTMERFSQLLVKQFERAKFQLEVQAFALFKKYPALNDALLLAMIGDFWAYRIVTINNIGGPHDIPRPSRKGPQVEKKVATTKRLPPDQEDDAKDRKEENDDDSEYKDSDPEPKSSQGKKRKQPPRKQKKKKIVYKESDEDLPEREEEFTTYYVAGSRIPSAKPYEWRDVKEEYKAKVREAYPGFEADILQERAWSKVYIFNTPPSNQMQYILTLKMETALNVVVPAELLGAEAARVFACLPVPWDDDWHSAVECPNPDQEDHGRPDDSSDPGEGSGSEEGSEEGEERDKDESEDEDEEDPQSSDRMDMSPRCGRDSPTRTIEMASPSSTGMDTSPTHRTTATLASPSGMSDMSTNSSSMPFAPLSRDGAGSPTPESSTRQTGGTDIRRNRRLLKRDQHGRLYYPEVED